jgi:hypothetical protein
MGGTVVLPFVGPIRRLFGFTVPTPEHLAMAFVLVILYFASTESAKLLFYKYWNGGAPVLGERESAKRRRARD